MGRAIVPADKPGEQSSLYHLSHAAKRAQIAGLLGQGATYSQIQALTGSSRPTIAKVSKALQAGEQVAPVEFLEQFRAIEPFQWAELKQLCFARAREALLDDARCAKTPAKDYVITGAVIDDKERLARGEPTSITEHRHLEPDEIAAKRKQWLSDWAKLSALEAEYTPVDDPDESGDT